MSTYAQMTNPEIVAAIARLDEEERAKALKEIGTSRAAAVQEIIDSHPEQDGARAAVLERLGREKQIRDSQAWTADGISPNSPLVTEATAGKFKEAANPEGAIDEMVADTAKKADVLLAGHDTSKTLSSDEAASKKDTAPLSPPSDAGTGEAERPAAVVGDKVTVGGQAGEIIAVDGAGYATAILLADGTEVNGVEYLYVDKAKAKADKAWQKVKE
jgi:hypothetical protein